MIALIVSRITGRGARGCDGSSKNLKTLRRNSLIENDRSELID